MVMQTIKLGYKQTEVGVMPEDWEVKKLEDIGRFKKGRGIKKDEVRDEGSPCIRYGEIYTHHDEHIKKFYSFIPLEVAIQSQKIKRGDLLFAGSGETAEEIGKCVAFLGDEEAYAGGDIIIFSPSDSESNSYFLGYLMNYETIVRQKANMAQGEVIVHIYSNNLKKIALPFPKQEEQSAIAQVLSDTDKLIKKLDNLIEKKKNIKQGAMQELLKGKRRLPGFSEEWEVKKLGDLLDYEQPTKYLVKDTKYNDHHNTPVLTAGKTFVLGFTDEETGIYRNVPVIIFDDFTTANKYVTFSFKAKSSAMKMLQPRNVEVNLKFVFEKMQLIDFNIDDHKRYWISEYQHLEIKTPKSEEQIAVAQVLSDMDSEIEELEKMRDKYLMLKKGMMQQLLTGRIRLR